jgi:hypothetical protein
MGRERPAGARVGSRLFRDLGGRRHRPAAVGAGDGGARVEIRGASSLGSVEAGERPPTWNACRKSPKACGRRGRGVGIAPMPQHGQATTGGLEHAAPLERDRGTVRSAEPALGAAIGRLSLAAAAAAQEQARRAGCFWFALRSRRCASGWSVRTSRRADPPGDRPTGLRGGGHPVDQSESSSGVAPWWGWSWRCFSAHGRRAEYLTGAARRGIAAPEAMRQCQHRSVQQTASYYNDGERAQGRATSLGL